MYSYKLAKRNFFKVSITNIFDKYASIITKRIRGKPCAWINDETSCIGSGKIRGHQKQTATLQMIIINFGNT